VSARNLPAVMGDHTGIYRVTILRTPADAVRLTGEYVEADDMYRRGGSDRSEWIEFTGSVHVERLDADFEPLDQDVLLAGEFNARFGTAFPVGGRK
jgi:hypothetical protein